MRNNYFIQSNIENTYTVLLMMMKTSLNLLLLCLLASDTAAFSVTQSSTVNPTTRLMMAAQKENGSNFDNSNGNMDRRSLFQTAAKVTLASAVSLSLVNFMPEVSYAAEETTTAISTPTRVVVAGATGQTGRRVLERLAATPGLTVIAGVRSPEKAAKSLEQESTVIRGAMVQKVASVDTSSVELVKLDVVKDTVDDLAATLAGADSLVIAIGFIPGNPLKMNAAAHQVDNLGTIALVDAAKKAGVKKVVMVSSILTNGRNWGQEKSPGFVITNAFGNVLDEKLIADWLLMFVWQLSLTQKLATRF